MREEWSDRNPPPSGRQLMIVLGGAAIVVIGLIWGLLLLLNALIAWVPVSWEQQLGRLILPAIAPQAQTSPAQTALNQLLGELVPLLPENQRRDRQFRVLYLPDKTVNAMAIPGDAIVVYRGLVEEVASENELMMVLGHELGHFAHRDHLRRLAQALGWRVVLGLVLGDNQGIATAIGDSVQVLAAARYSQGQETAADRLGLDLLIKHYGHAGGATDFFQRLQNENGSRLDFLASHPNPGRRVQEIQRWITKEGYAVRSPAPLPPSLLAIGKIDK